MSNRRDRRRQAKQGGGRAGGGITTATPRDPMLAVSERLLAHAGQGAVTVDLDTLPNDLADPIAGAAANLARRQVLRQQLSALERQLIGAPDPVLLLTSIGKIQHDLGDLAAAAKAYARALEIVPDNDGIRHMVAALGGGQAPARANDTYVQALFDGFAQRFDQSLGMLGYDAPRLIAETVAATLAPAPQSLAVLDLGCGTGLSGLPFRDFARRLDGVDLSAGMLAKAAERRLYDDLAQAEIGTHLAAIGRRYDLIVAADVLIYFGALDEVFIGAARALTAAGHLAFTVEDAGALPAPGYKLNPHGRYAHDPAMVRAALTAADLAVVVEQPVVLRKEKGADVPGRLFLAKRGR